MWFMVCRWLQSQEGDWAGPHTPFLQVSTTWALDLSGNGSPETMCDKGFKSKYIFSYFRHILTNLKKPLYSDIYSLKFLTHCCR